MKSRRVGNKKVKFRFRQQTSSGSRAKLGVVVAKKENKKQREKVGEKLNWVARITTPVCHRAEKVNESTAYIFSVAFASAVVFPSPSRSDCRTVLKQSTRRRAFQFFFFFFLEKPSVVDVDGSSRRDLNKAAKRRRRAKGDPPRLCRWETASSVVSRGRHGAAGRAGQTERGQ